MTGRVHPPGRVLTVCDSWDSGLGGVATVNRMLSIGLAQAGYSVTARVTRPGQHPLVDISVAQPIAGLTTEQAWLLSPKGLPEGVTTVIGHSRFSGGPAAELRDMLYPDAHLVHLLHTSPEELGRLQGNPELGARNADWERSLFARADLVVAVGPLLAEEARRLAAQSGDRPPPVHELIPGIEAGPMPGYGADRERPRRLLLFGRADEPLKGAANAAKIVRELGDRGWDVELTVRGSKPANVDKLESELSRLAGRQVRVKPFTSDPADITADLHRADLVLVASEHEDFGLVATEAAGHGVPFLVGRHTGAGQFLADPARVPPALVGSSVVAQRSSDTRAWAGHVQHAFETIGEQRTRAAALREHVTTRYTWASAAQALMDRLADIPRPGRTAPQHPPLAAAAFPQIGGQTRQSTGVGWPGQGRPAAPPQRPPRPYR